MLSTILHWVRQMNIEAMPFTIIKIPNIIKQFILSIIASKNINSFLFANIHDVFYILHIAFFNLGQFNELMFASEVSQESSFGIDVQQSVKDGAFCILHMKIKWNFRVRQILFNIPQIRLQIINSPLPKER